MAQSQQRHGDTGKAFRRKHILYLYVLAGACQVEKSPCHACYGPGYDHAHDNIPFFIDARVPAGIPVKAHCLKLIAKGGLIEDNPDNQHGGNGQKDTAAHAGLRKQLIHSHLGNLGRGSHISGFIAQVVKERFVALYNPVYHIHTDIVHHNGGNNLIYIKAGFQKSRDHSPQSPAQYCCQQGHGPLYPPQPRPHDTHIDCREGAHNKLPRRTDIEQACLKGKANGKTGQYDGGCIVKHLPHALQTVGKCSCQDGHKSRQCLGRIAYKEYDKSYQQSDNNGKDR